MTAMRHLGAIAACILALGLAGEAGAFPAAAGTKIRAGMSEQQVVELLGRPTARLSTRHHRTIIWTQRPAHKVKAGSKLRTLAFVFDQHNRLVMPIVSMHHVVVS
jgi:hypothetical protein